MDSVQIDDGVSYRQTLRNLRLFVGSTFFLCWMLTLISVIVYRKYSVNPDRIFYMIMITVGGGISLPLMAIMSRVATKAYLLGAHQSERLTTVIHAFKEAYDKAPNLLENAKVVMDKAVPIAHNVEDIVTRAKGMAGDVETIAHKVRTTMDALNGSLDVKTLELHLKEAKDSLKTIAEAFGGGVKPSGSTGLEPESEIELVPGGRRRKS